MNAARKLVVLSSIGLGLAACTSSDERRQDGQHQADVDNCQGQGFSQGSVEFADCVSREEVVRLLRNYHGGGRSGAGITGF
jgi:hypothetical protein